MPRCSPSAWLPQELIIALLGKPGSHGGLLRAVTAGVLLDLCGHGILAVGAKLCQRGASAGQIMAFLIASPWNSFSLTLILITLIGLGWTLSFIALLLPVITAPQVLLIACLLNTCSAS